MKKATLLLLVVVIKLTDNHNFSLCSHDIKFVLCFITRRGFAVENRIWKVRRWDFWLKDGSSMYFLIISIVLGMS